MGLFNQAKALAKNAGSSLNESLDQSKVNSKITAEKKKIGESFSKIGKLYYEMFEDSSKDNNAQIVELCQGIEESEALIKQLEEDKTHIANSARQARADNRAEAKAADEREAEERALRKAEAESKYE